MKKVTINTEFVIGIDFGHGETSAAFYDLKSQTKLDIDILPGLKVIKSAVAILEQEGQQTVCVGNAAIVSAPMAKDFQVSFKKRPSEMSPIERSRMVAFMKGVYAGILDRHPDYKTREHVVYIARPSQDKLWKSEEAAYLKIAEDAGLPVAGIQKESRAAYFKARTQPDSKIDNYVNEGILIVDYGSSTVDFTYLNGSLPGPIDDGRDLGASEVEKILLDYALSNPKDPFMPEFAKAYGKRPDSIPYNSLLYRFREAKEAFYANKQPVFSVSFDYNLLTSSEPNPIYGFGGIAIPRAELNHILGKNKNGGYIERVKKAVEAFKRDKLGNNKVVCVYLTGGASRMDFVREIFMKVFGLDEAHCLCDDNPSLIVSQGIAHLSYADIKTAKTEDELKKIAQDVIAGYDWTGNFKNIIRNSIKTKIIDVASNVMSAYKDGRVGEYLELKKDYSPKGEFICMQCGKGTNGYVMVRNIRSLNVEFKSKFESLVDYDFAVSCEDSIKREIIDSVVSELKDKLSAFAFPYNSWDSFPLKLNGLSASLTISGVEQLSDKFTKEGSGHIVYDAVASCYLTMATWNLYKDRWDRDRLQHYNYYRTHYADIFTSEMWGKFLSSEIKILGIESAKKQTIDYINNLINSYVSYAKLKKFF